MDQLTPTLSDIQIKQNIDALQKQGVANDKIQSYVNNYSKDPTGNYVLKNSPNQLPDQTTKTPTNIGTNIADLSTKIGSGAKEVGGFLANNEVNFGQDIAGAASNILPGSVTGATALQQAAKTHADTISALTAQIKQKKAAGEDTTRLAGVLKDNIKNAPPGMADLYPSINKSAWQVLGDAAGTALDIASAGSYGAAAKGAESGVLLTKAANTAAKAATVPIEQATKQALSQTLKTIGKQTAIRSTLGAAQGYGYDVTNNLSGGKTGASAFTPGVGTATGAIIPAGIGAVQAGAAIAKDQAPRIINSLIKPLAKDFSYGKNPGRAVSEMGITGNSLEDLSTNISQARQQVGQSLQDIYSHPDLEGVKINVKPEVDKIDAAITEASKGGKNNQAIVTRLQNAKEALLYEHSVNAAGDIVKTAPDLSRAAAQFEPKGDTSNYIATYDKYIASGDMPAEQIYKDVTNKVYQPTVAKQLISDAQMALQKEGVPNAEAIGKDLASKLSVDNLTPQALIAAGKEAVATAAEPVGRDLTNLSPLQAFQFKKEIGDMTKFTGNASDDKLVNSTLKQVYGGIKDKINSAVTPIAPELPKLNERYADLTSAEIATKYRDVIDKRQNYLPAIEKLSGGAGLLISAGTHSFWPSVIGLGAAGVEAALASPYAKTRIAAQLGKETPGFISKLFTAHPEIAQVIGRAIPKYASQMSHAKSNFGTSK